ncbi:MULTISPECIES: DUF86 domain-containing protein [unclassified Adlercreutzia]|uniref:HepT-like ribonuclease domain-containing protein n=1 Tax=unclassified Adlercreutzia TaxID=2636013 RepID=UPI0013EB2E00|nr:MULTISPECIES: HepT-like ribonuclease domain-containing protein [unclassified Adlercreutzia]
MSESDELILSQILDYCEKIEQRIAEFSIDEDAFVENTAYFDMLLMPVFQIGELVGALSEELTSSDQEVPWHAIRGFRNIIGHDYGVVDPLWAWNTIQVDIPNLKDAVARLIADCADC